VRSQFWASIVEDLGAPDGYREGRPSPIVGPMTTKLEAKIGAAGSAGVY